LAVAAKRRHEAADFPLLFDQQAFELLQFGVDITARFRRALYRFHTKGGAGEELDDAVVDIARQGKPGPGGGAGFDRLEQRMTIEDRARRPAKLPAEINEVGRKTANAPQDEPSLKRPGTHLRDDAFAKSEVARLIEIE